MAPMVMLVQCVLCLVQMTLEPLMRVVAQGE